ncbi:hypothetical protein ACWDR1_19205 [Streptosporangium sandarakinum]
MLKPTSRIIIAAALSAGALMANPAYAVAASYTPEDVCGTGFGRVNDGSRVVKTSTGKVYGRVYLLYNRSTGFNCVTTIKSSFIGSATYVMTRLEVQTKRIKNGPMRTVEKHSEGKYKYYAGPVKLYGKDQCVKYWGIIKSGGRAPQIPTGSRTSQITAGDRASQIATGGRASWGNCG